MNSHTRAKRQQVEGWTDSSTRRNTRFLYSVDERKLTGHGFALSLTIRDCPATGVDWGKVRRSYLKRLERMGMVRCHWLTEWQRRGVPHMHAAIWFDEDLPQRDPYAPTTLVEHWMAVAAEYGVGQRAQNVKRITDSVGWFQYLSKHAVRGLNHYQRSPDGIPTGWKKTGRMWGHTGEWPTIDPTRYTLTREAFFAYRRLVRSWRFADARASGDRYRVRSARRMLQCNERALSEVRGVAEWIKTDTTQQILRHLAALGHEITC